MSNLDSIRRDVLDQLDVSTQGLYDGPYLGLLHQLLKDIGRRIGQTNRRLRRERHSSNRRRPRSSSGP